MRLKIFSFCRNCYETTLLATSLLHRWIKQQLRYYVCMDACVLARDKQTALPKRILTVSGQNTIGIYIIPLASIQHTAQKQNIVTINCSSYSWL